MQQHIICHCGKCEIKCNKHGKRAKCADCGRRRMLGTVIKKNTMRHVCDECCQKLIDHPMEEESKNDWNEWEKV